MVHRDRYPRHWQGRHQVIFLKVIDETGSPGLVAMEKILFISTDASSEEAEVQCRIHMDGGLDNYVDVRNTLDDLVERMISLMGGQDYQAPEPVRAYDPIIGR